MVSRLGQRRSMCLLDLVESSANESRSSFGIYEQAPQAYIQSDLDLFYASLAINVPKGTAPTLDSIDGGTPQHIVESFDYNGESDLDLEYAIALGMLSLPLQYTSLTTISASAKGHLVPSRRFGRRRFVQQFPRRHRWQLLFLCRWR